MSLERQAAGGAYWTGSSSVAVTVLQFAQLAVLARLLVPEDFGLMAMMMVVIGFAQAFADMGISNAIIHRQDTTDDHLSSLYWLNILAGIVLILLLLAAVPGVVTLFTEPRLAELIPVIALIFLIAPFGQVYQALLQKNLRFRELSVSEISGAALGAAVAITAAVAGQGIYALIFGQLANTACRTAVLIGYGWREWRPSLHFRRRDLDNYLSFGLFQMGERSINFLGQRVDQLLIGALLGAQALGYYHLAFNLVILPVTRINPVLTRVAFPIFARVQNDAAKLRHGYMTMQRVLSAVNFPLLLGLAAVAPVFIPLVLGEQWAPSIVLVQFLAGVALIRSTGNPVGSLLLGKGRADLGFYWNVWVVLTQIPAVYVGAKVGGTVGVATALLLMQIAYFWCGYHFLVRRLLGPCLQSYLATLGPAALTAGIMALAVAGMAEVAIIGAHPLLIVQVGIGALLYVALNWLLFRSQTISILRLVSGRST
ncbi:MAG: MOP flippase family protein [Alphaproteobacteria bacterium]|nr:MOP flippase family protein [Alphaproteobacteria bacterium]